MRILIAPDKFAGTLTAAEAAEAVAAGWSRARPEDETVTLPLADGGPGFVDVLDAALPGAVRHTVSVPDPLGRAVEADYLRDGDTAYIESAAACGLHLLDRHERDPARATTYGLGLLIASAIEHGARRLVIGLGGSATSDGGLGMLTALGLTFRDEFGDPVLDGADACARVAAVEGHARTRGVEFVAASDVDSPLLGPAGAAYVFGPQKGATEAALPLLDAALGRFAEVCERGLDQAGTAAKPGAGAAGGLGFALFLLGGRRESGARLTCDAVGLDAAIAAADVVISGEGSFDSQSLRGKLAAEVATGAAEHGRPCLVLAGRSDLDAHPDLVGVHSVAGLVGGAEAAMEAPAEGLAELAAEVARTWEGSRE